MNFRQKAIKILGIFEEPIESNKYCDALIQQIVGVLKEK